MTIPKTIDMTEPLTLLNNIPGLLIYKIGAREFCMDVKNVHKILPLKVGDVEINRAESESGVYGRLKFEGLEYVVLDSEKFFYGNIVESRDKKVVLCTIFGKRAGILVDLIIEFISLDALFVEKNIDFKLYKREKYISWYLEYQGRKLYYPNFEIIAKELSSQGFFLSILI